jgi:hypothetical protein
MNSRQSGKFRTIGYSVVIFILYGSILFEKFVESLIENTKRKPLPCSESRVLKPIT